MAKRRFRSRGRFSRIRRRRGFRSKRLRRIIKRTVRRMQEIKYGLVHAQTSVDTGTTLLINITPDIVQGDGKSGRLGAMIKYKFMTFKLWIYGTPFAEDPGSFGAVRAVIFQPRVQPDSNTSPAYQTNTIFDQDSDLLLSTIKHYNVRVLWDKVILLGTRDNAQLSQIPMERIYKIKRPLRNNVQFRTSQTIQPNDPKDTYYLFLYATFPDGARAQAFWFNKISFYDL